MSSEQMIQILAVTRSQALFVVLRGSKSPLRQLQSVANRRLSQHATDDAVHDPKWGNAGPLIADRKLTIEMQLQMRAQIICQSVFAQAVKRHYQTLRSWVFNAYSSSLSR